jgi:hypothetical protein
MQQGDIVLTGTIRSTEPYVKSAEINLAALAYILADAIVTAKRLSLPATLGYLRLALEHLDDKGPLGLRGVIQPVALATKSAHLHPATDPEY